MVAKPDCRLEPEQDGWCLRLAGDWRLAHLAALGLLLERLDWPAADRLTVDGADLTALDSAAAMLLLRRLAMRGVAAPAWRGLAPRQQALVTLVAERLASPSEQALPRHRWLARLGGLMLAGLAVARGQLAFFGRICAGLGELVVSPRRFRTREFLVQLEAVGLRAIGIVALMTFLIGVVFAYLLGIQIEKYGANIFIVDGVALAVARELAPMLTAILVAGRSGAAFTAQIGAMKVTEEIDAIATLGLSPVQVLVIPRLLAIALTMPLLTFIGDVMGLLGAAVIAATQLDITWYTFFTRLQDVLPLDSVTYGLWKAPVFAAAIALIACRNGFAVSRDARSVGEYTTTTVVKSLVAVILIDAAFAVASPEIT